MTGPRPSLWEYQEVVRDTEMLDQLCACLVMKHKLDPKLINDLVSLLPNADHFDFYAFRTGKISLGELKGRILNVDRKYIKSREDLVK
jgi:hypothetical protein